MFSKHSLPYKKNTGPDWFDKTCYNAKKKFNAAKNLFNRHKTNENRAHFVETRTEYNSIKRKAKFKNKRIKGANICKLAKTKPKEFWRRLKSNIRQHEDDNVDIDDLYSHFKSIYTSNEDNYVSETTQNTNTNISDEELDCPFTESELKKAIFQQKNNKACGPDNISAEYLKHSYDITSSFLLSFYNRVFNEGSFPEEWGKGIIIPIYKGGDRTCPGNYRAITLNSILSKVYSQLILNRLDTWVKNMINCQIHTLVSKRIKVLLIVYFF